MHDLPHGLYHGNRVFGLKYVPSHVNSDSASLYGVITQLERVLLRNLFASGHDNRHGAGPHDLFKVVAIIGLHDVRPELGGNPARESEIPRVPYHLFTDG